MRELWKDFFRTLRGRLALPAMLLLASGTYLPLNQLQKGGFVFKTALDAYIPIWPVWVFPYLLCIPVWVLCFLYAAWKMDDRLYRAFTVGALFVILVGVSFFTFWPTYVERPVLQGSDIATKVLQRIYSQDGAYNAFPSGHLYYTTITALFWSRWRPKDRLWMAAFVLIAALSTVFTGQHYLPDPIGGIVLGVIGYRFGLWWEEKWSRKPTAAKIVSSKGLKE